MVTGETGADDETDVDTSDKDGYQLQKTRRQKRRERNQNRRDHDGNHKRASGGGADAGAGEKSTLSQNGGARSGASKTNGQEKPHQNTVGDGNRRHLNERRQRRHHVDRKVGTRQGENEFLSTKAGSSGKKIWLFLSKVKLTITEDIIRNYIVENAQTAAEDVEVKLCKVKQSNARHNCFMIGVKPDFKDAVYQEGFWPYGVVFDRFNFGMGRNFLSQ